MHLFAKKNKQGGYESNSDEFAEESLTFRESYNQTKFKNVPKRSRRKSRVNFSLAKGIKSGHNEFDEFN